MQADFINILYVALAAFLLTSCDSSEPAEIVQIPDPAFLSALIAEEVDKDGDGQISYPEAEATVVLLIPPSGITDLTGLDAFNNLDSLTISLNPLAGIDLSGNTLLRYLNCTYCELHTLDISSNLLLEEVICSRNYLTELDVSNNQNLIKLSCKNNLLTRLDLSAITDLTQMVSCGNKLSRLDISMHPNLSLIGVDNMPMLEEVCVWALPFPPEGVRVLMGYSPNIEFTSNCTW